MEFKNQPTVTLNKHTVNPVITIIQTIRRCRNSFDKSDSKMLESNMINHLGVAIIGKADMRLLEGCINQGHTSPFEFVDFEFLIHLSKIADRQQLRHRISSFMQESGRSCSLSCFYVPDKIANNEKALDLYVKGIKEIEKRKDLLIEMGIPLEDARYLQPSAAMSHLLYKANLRSIRNFLHERTCIHAQEEVRSIALQIHRLVKNVHPILVSKCEKYYHCDLKCGKCIREE